MTFDYGFRGKVRWRGPARTAALAGVALIAGLAGVALWASIQRDNENNAADARAYGASGPPCPVTTPARLAVEGPRLRHTFDYGGMSLSHAFGDSDCAWIVGKGGRYPICRFTSPGSLEIRDGKTDQLFAPGIGRPAAVLRQGGQVRCLMTARDMG